jgi:HK97 family phage portal protein
MGLITRLFAEGNAPATPSPSDDYWYGPVGLMTASGMRVGADAAMRIADVYACVRVISQAIASAPCIVYHRLPDGGKERAYQHPLYRVLHDAPNALQTSFEFREMLQAHLELRGNAYAQKVGGNKGAIEQLVPLHPDKVSVEVMPDGRVRYKVQKRGAAPPETLVQDEVLHFRGLSQDGVVGMSTLEYARETFGMQLAAQDFAARFLANDSKPSVVLRFPKSLSDKAAIKLRESWQMAHTGANRGKAAVIEEGGDITTIGVTNKDAQFLESRQWQRGQIASIFGVPPHKIGDLTKATFSNIEQQAIEFVTDCIRPRVIRLEQRINLDLIEPLEVGEPGEYFCEFLLDAILRGDMKARYEAYQVGIQNGFLNSNEVRAMENMNPRDGGDEYIRPMNMVPSGTPGPDPNNEEPSADPADGDTEPADGDDNNARARMRLVALAAAERVVRKEVQAVRKASHTMAAAEFADYAKKFYREHREFVISALRLSESEARAYATTHCAVAVVEQERGTADSIFDSWELKEPKRLAALALGEM